MFSYCYYRGKIYLCAGEPHVYGRKCLEFDMICTQTEDESPRPEIASTERPWLVNVPFTDQKDSYRIFKPNLRKNYIVVISYHRQDKHFIIGLENNPERLFVEEVGPQTVEMLRAMSVELHNKRIESPHGCYNPAFGENNPVFRVSG